MASRRPAKLTVSPYFSGRGKRSTAVKALTSRKRTHTRVEYEVDEDANNIAVTKSKEFKTEANMNVGLDTQDIGNANVNGNKKPESQSKSKNADAEPPSNKPPYKRKAGKGKTTTSGSSLIDWKPLNWEKVLTNLKEMRKNQNAPVDSQGCEKAADPLERPEVVRYQTLISLMLSSQTKDHVNFAAMTRLKEHGLNVDNILKTSEEKIGKLIYPVGFWQRKVQYIAKATEICKTNFHSDIPDTLEGLLTLPGVGPKMAHICMNVAWGKMTGIGVDTHVHRISNRLGWVKETTKTPENTRKALESWLPSEHWQSINLLMVGFGQQHCLPIGPKCSTCLNKELCPYGRSGKADKKTVKSKTVKTGKKTTETKQK